MDHEGKPESLAEAVRLFQWAAESETDDRLLVRTAITLQRLVQASHRRGAMTLNRSGELVLYLYDEIIAPIMLKPSDAAVPLAG